MKFGLLLATAICTLSSASGILPPLVEGASAQTSSSDAVVIRRAVIAAQSSATPDGSVTPTPTPTGTPAPTPTPVATGSEADPENLYAWFSMCGPEGSMSMCYSFDAFGNPAPVEESYCLSTTLTSSQIGYLEYLGVQYGGSKDFFGKPGPAPVLDCGGASGEQSLGYGYSCAGGNFTCFYVDKNSPSNGQTFDPTACVTQNGPGFENALAASGLFPASPSLDPDTTCEPSGETFYGRTERCEWSADGQGNRTLSAVERCYSATPNPFTGTVVEEVSLSTCESAPTGSQTVISDRRQAGLLDPSAERIINCGETDAGILSSRIVSDTTATNAEGNIERTISYTYTCKVNGSSVSPSSCAVALANWTSSAQQFAGENNLGFEIQEVAGTRTEIYTEIGTYTAP